VSRAALRAGILAAAFALLAGPSCGKRGNPQAPEPTGPRPPVDVRVRQIGPDVIVAASVPSRRGDRPSQEPVALELIAVGFPPGAEISERPDVFRRRGRVVVRWPDGGAASPVAGARAYLVDPVVSSDGVDRTGWNLRYAVRVVDRRGRISPLASSPTIVPVAPPPVPTGVRAEAVAQGIALHWTGAGEDARYRVYRAVGDGPIDEKPRNPAALAEATFVDEDVALGTLYRYVVRAEAPGEGPSRESASSAEIALRAEDRFAPRAPERLVVVQEGPFVRLFWDPGAERDLVGYEIERAVGEGDWVALTGAEPVRDARYLDRDVAVGQRIRYRVFAVDDARPPNRSEPSDEVVVVVAPDPGAGASR